jgi:hypothetical protein
MGDIVIMRALRTLTFFLAALILPFAIGAVAADASPASTATTALSCHPTMRGTFLQPSFPLFSWDSTRYDQELTAMNAVGIRSVILQWTVDMDANQAYYPDPASWYPQGANLVGSLLSSAGRHGTAVVLGLANVYNWQAHATDSTWLANQLYVDEQTADQLYARFQGKFKGWYVSNEVNDSLLANPAAVGPMTWFFGSLAGYLHTHDGNLTVMESPTYSGLNESTPRFAQSVRSVLGSVDIVDVQDGGGSGYIRPSDISNWFSALHSVFAGTKTQVWSDADMYDNGAPMDPAQLQADLKATCGLATGWTGFSFTTQMGPQDLGTSTYFDAYRSYVG